MVVGLSWFNVSLFLFIHNSVQAWYERIVDQSHHGFLVLENVYELAGITLYIHPNLAGKVITSGSI